jgi:hypothetical protein
MDLKMKLMETVCGGNLQLRHSPELRKSLNLVTVDGDTRICF